MTKKEIKQKYNIDLNQVLKMLRDLEIEEYEKYKKSTQQLDIDYHDYNQEVFFNVREYLIELKDD